MPPTLEIDGFDDAECLFTGTIVVDGAPMRVWVPDELADAATQAFADDATDADEVPF